MRAFLISFLLILALIFALFLRVSSNPESEPSFQNPVLPLPTPKHETAIVAAPDGTVYLVEIGTGNVLWSFSSGESIYSSFHQIPSHEEEKLNTPSDVDDFYIDCGEDWELYLHGKGLQKVKLPLNAEDLVNRSPVVSAGSGVMLGSKKTAVFIVDAVTGKVVRTIRSDSLPSSVGNDTDESSNLTTEIQEWMPSSPSKKDEIEKPLYVTRTDYALSYSSVKTGKVLWYLMFADIEASYRCDGIENFFGRFPDDLNLPMHCHTRPVVHRIRDRSSLESLFIGSRVQGNLLGNILPSLPASNNQEMEPGDKISGTVYTKNVMPGPLEIMMRTLALGYNDDRKSALALPASEPSEMNGQSPGITGPPQISSPSQHSVQYLTVSSMIAALGCLFFARFIKQRKKPKDPNSQKISPKELKLQNVAPRKRKGRRTITKQDISNDRKHEENSQDVPGGIPKESNNVSGDIGGLLSYDHLDSYSHSEEGRKIGKLVVTNKEIAKGSNGTIVLEGIFNGRPVAVKRLVKTHHSVAVKEIQNLIASDQHPNIVRWYGVEYDPDFVYLCLERCTCNLYDLISSCASANQPMASSQELVLWKPNGYPSPCLLKLMRDIVLGLAHMHELGIVHRDLKPQNILVIKDRTVTAKISDMGISKHLEGEMSSLTAHTTGHGTSGWQAPEQLRRGRQTCAVDLFSLGCVLFFCITGGFHPFGENVERDVNILNDRKDLFLIDHIPEAVDMISQLLDPKPKLRPKAVEAMNHPLFWNSEMRLSFLRDASDRVELEDPESDFMEELESKGRAALGGKWDEKMDSAFINDIGRYRKYKYDSIRDLLRVIRNKLNHYRELSKEVQETLGTPPDGFDAYFTVRFPKLLIDVYNVVFKYCADEETFAKYFKGT